MEALPRQDPQRHPQRTAQRPGGARGSAAPRRLLRRPRREHAPQGRAHLRALALRTVAPCPRRPRRDRHPRARRADGVRRARDPLRRRRDGPVRIVASGKLPPESEQPPLLGNHLAVLPRRCAHPGFRSLAARLDCAVVQARLGSYHRGATHVRARLARPRAAFRRRRSFHPLPHRAVALAAAQSRRRARPGHLPAVAGVIGQPVCKVARILLCVAAAAVAAFYLRRMPFAEMAGSLRGAQPVPLLLAALVYVGPNTAAKVWRWASLLAAVPRRGQGLGSLELARVLFASQAASNLLPARAGEALRVVELRRRGYGTTGIVAAQLYEKVVEAASLCLLAGIAPVARRHPPLPGPARGAAGGGAGGGPPP